MSEYTVKKIATIYNGFSEKFGIPRQSGLSSAQSVIRFEESYQNADSLRGLEQYSHLWLVWVFSKFDNEGWSPTVRPPRLGGNKRMGVFATRSPNRPNPIGLSVVEIVKIEPSTPYGPQITVKGADLLSGTPILDIKPYLPYADAYPDALCGFAQQKLEYALEVDVSDTLLEMIPTEHQMTVLQLLSQDPRPAYQNDPQRIYTMTYADISISFQVNENKLKVVNVRRGIKSENVSGT